MFTQKEKQKIYNDAAEKWGIKNQMVVALEELSELQVEIAKHFNGKRDDDTGLIDELADAKIMIEQIEQHFKLRSSVKSRINRKLLRLKKIIKG